LAVDDDAVLGEEELGARVHAVNQLLERHLGANQLLWRLAWEGGLWKAEAAERQRNVRRHDLGQVLHFVDHAHACGAEGGAGWH